LAEFASPDHRIAGAVWSAAWGQSSALDTHEWAVFIGPGGGCVRWTLMQSVSIRKYDLVVETAIHETSRIVVVIVIVCVIGVLAMVFSRICRVQCTVLSACILRESSRSLTSAYVMNRAVT
jgi:hypothetical protein